MQKELLKVIIREGQDEIRDVRLYKRPFEFEEEGRYVLVGIRQGSPICSSSVPCSLWKQDMT